MAALLPEQKIFVNHVSKIRPFILDHFLRCSLSKYENIHTILWKFAIIKRKISFRIIHNIDVTKTFLIASFQHFPQSYFIIRNHGSAIITRYSPNSYYTCYYELGEYSVFNGASFIRFPQF